MFQDKSMLGDGYDQNIYLDCSVKTGKRKWRNTSYETIEITPVRGGGGLTEVMAMETKR